MRERREGAGVENVWVVEGRDRAGHQHWGEGVRYRRGMQIRTKQRERDKMEMGCKSQTEEEQKETG